MTQNTERFMRPRPVIDPDATAYIDLETAADAYRGTSQYWERAGAEAQDVISQIGLLGLIGRLSERDTAAGWYESTAAFTTDVDDVFTGDLRLS